MRLVLKELLDGFGDTPDQIGEVLVIAIKESHLPDGDDGVGIVVSEEVDESDDHWANKPSMRPYTLAEIKALLVADQRARRQRHQERAAMAGVRSL